MQAFFIKQVLVLLDDEDYIRVKDVKWRLLKTKGRNKYLVIGRPLSYKQNILLHRYVYIINGIEIPDDKEIDHKNGNGLDNRKENLRVSTHRENMLNRQCAQKNSKTKYVGVQYMKQISKYRAYVCINRKLVHIGVYTTPMEANDARNAYIISNKLDCKCYYYDDISTLY